MTINDAHVHFFSPQFFASLGGDPATLGWHDPVSPEALADRWVAELDDHGVTRAALIASVPADEQSVAVALSRHPSRFVGFFMVDPTKADAIDRVTSGIELGLRGVCLFPAMQRYAIQDPRAIAVFERAAGEAGAVVFVHCGVLSVGARKLLGKPSPFDMRFGNPLDLHTVALRFPTLPIIVPHFGAGLLREALMLGDMCPNVHLDTSSSNAWIRYTPGLTLDAVFKSAVSVLGPGRLLFGTDSSYFPRGWNADVYDVQFNAMKKAGLDDVARMQLLAGNFDRLFPLD